MLFPQRTFVRSMLRLFNTQTTNPILYVFTAAAAAQWKNEFKNKNTLSLSALCYIFLARSKCELFF
jgi:hypothetical protein